MKDVKNVYRRLKEIYTSVIEMFICLVVVVLDCNGTCQTASILRLSSVSGVNGLFGRFVKGSVFGWALSGSLPMISKTKQRTASGKRR